MLSNYFKTAFRNFRNRKSYSVITIAGLSLGLTCCLLITLYIQQELSFDRFHEKADRIFRIAVKTTRSSGTDYKANTQFPVAPAFKQDFPEVEAVARLFQYSDVSVKSGDNRYYEEAFYFADPDFYRIFSFHFLQGNPEKALDSPDSIVITASVAKKYFGENDALGRVLRLDDDLQFQVTGVVEDVPVNSHFHFDFTASMLAVTEEMVGVPLDEWGGFMDLWTYVLLPENLSPDALSLRMEDFQQKHGNFPQGLIRIQFLQPLPDIHLKSHLDSEIEATNHVSNLLILGTIALFILVIACINYINLSTAHSAKRAREVGMRKVLGALKPQLIRQFLSESAVLAGIAFFLSLFWIELLLPTFSSLVGTPVDFVYRENGTLLLLGFICSILVGLLSGIYPAFFLSGYQPIKVIKGSLEIRHSSFAQLFFRKALVVKQFVISILLIIGTLIINQQLKYMKNARLGFNKEQTVMLPIYQDQAIFDSEVNKDYSVIKQELLNLPGVAAVSACFRAPISQNNFRVSVFPEGEGGANRFSFQMNFVDYDFIDNFGLKVIAGRKFSQEFSTDHRGAFILNQAAANRLGYDSPEAAIGKKFTIGLNKLEGTIIAVTADYHISSMREDIEPLILMYWPSLFIQTAVRIDPGNVAAALKDIEQVWNRFRPEYPFQFAFLDENIDRLYRQEEQTSAIIRTFSIIAVFIACLGLFALASYTAEKRIKEIGIRKVLGATVGNIVFMLSSEFAKWVLIANLVAWPAAYFILRRWLQGFAFRTSIGTAPFLIAAGLAFGIALLTVSTQAVKAALSDPVKSLHRE